MNFQYALPCLVWYLLASCVVIFPIRFDLSDFLCLEFPPLRLLAENRDKWNQLKSQRIGKITTQEARRHQVKQGKACFSVFHWKFMRVWINCTTLILSCGRLCFYMHFNNYFVERIREDMRWRMTSPLSCLLFSSAVSGKSTKSTGVKELDQARTESRSPWIPVEAVLDS